MVISSTQNTCLRPNKKKMNCFSGTAASVKNVFIASKNENEIKTTFSVQNMIIGKGHAVLLGRCGPLWVMMGCLIMLASISS